MIEAVQAVPDRALRATATLENAGIPYGRWLDFHDDVADPARVLTPWLASRRGS